MTPLHVQAYLAGRVIMPRVGYVHLDALLAAAVAKRDGLPPPLEETAIVPLEIPVQRSPCGRYHLASASVGQVAWSEVRHVHKRPPVAEAQSLGGPKLRSINVGAGASKGWRIPVEAQHLVDQVVQWWCVGDQPAVAGLLEHVTHIGRKRGVGEGQVARWEVSPCEVWDGFPVVRDGRPLRHLPVDHPGLVDPVLRRGGLTYPYWLRSQEITCAAPG